MPEQDSKVNLSQESLNSTLCARFTVTKMCECARRKRGMRFCNVSCNVPMDKALRIRMGKTSTPAIHIQPCGNFLSWLCDGLICTEASEYTKRSSTYFRK